MEGGRRSKDDLEVRLRWPGDVDDDSSPVEVVRPPEPRPQAEPRPFTSDAGRTRNGKSVESHSAGVEPPPAAPDAASHPSVRLERAFAALQADMADRLDTMQAQMADRLDTMQAQMADRLDAVQMLLSERLEATKAGIKPVLDRQQKALGRLSAEIEQLRGALEDVRDHPAPWFAEAVSSSVAEDLEALAAQVQMLRRRMALKAREGSGLDAGAVEALAQAVADRMLPQPAEPVTPRARPTTRATTTRRTRGT